MWQHQHAIGSDQTHIKHMNFTLLDVFSFIPHHDESQELQLFRTCEYELKLIDKSPISSESTTKLKQELYSTNELNLHTKNYTNEEWILCMILKVNQKEITRNEEDSFQWKKLVTFVKNISESPHSIENYYSACSNLNSGLVKLYQQ